MGGELINTAELSQNRHADNFRCLCHYDTVPTIIMHYSSVPTAEGFSETCLLCKRFKKVLFYLFSRCMFGLNMVEGKMEHCTTRRWPRERVP